MNRREIIRNSLMAIAASLVPRILQPAMPEVEGEQESFKGILWYVQNKGNVIHYPSHPDFYVEDLRKLFEDSYKRLI